MSKISDETIKLINERNIEPRGRWFFVVEDYAKWFFAGASAIISSLIVATLICVFNHDALTLCKYWDETLTHYVFMAPHYFWSAVLALFVIIASFNFRFTKNGYRYGKVLIFAGVVFLSLFFGYILFAVGFEDEIHDFFSEQVVGMSIFLF